MFLNPTQASSAGLPSQPLPVRLRPRLTQPILTMPIGLRWLLADYPPKVCLRTGSQTLTVTWALPAASSPSGDTAGTLPCLAALHEGLPGECRLRSQFMDRGWLRVRIDW